MSMNILKIEDIRKKFIQNPDISRYITSNERIVIFTHGDFDTFISNGTLYDFQTEYVDGDLWKLTAQKRHSTVKNSNPNKGEDGSKIRIPIELRLATNNGGNDRFSEDEVFNIVKNWDFEIVGKVLFRKSDNTIIGKFLD